MAFNMCSTLIIHMIGQLIFGARAQQIRARQPMAIFEEGRNFTFEWDFHLDSGDRLDQIVFGLWDNEFTSVYLMTVNRKEEPVENPNLKKKYPSFVNRVHWAGDFKSYAAFTLTNVKLSDSKSYGCELGVGGFGKTIASKITLTVEKRYVRLNFPELFRGPYDRIVSAGEETEFHWEYKVRDNKYAIKVEFSREKSLHSIATMKIQSNNTAIISKYSKRLFVSFTKTRHGKGRKFTFTLQKVTIEDAGKYIFKVYFEADSRMSDVYLYVKDRPKIVGSREAIQEGRELFLACEVKGNSTPQIGWLRNERLIPQQRENYLHIQNVTLTDAGSYKCCAFYQLRFSLTRFCSVKMPLQVKYIDSKTSKPKCASCIHKLGSAKERNTNRTIVKYLPYLGFLLIPILLCSLIALRLSKRKHLKSFLEVKVDDVCEPEVLENAPLIQPPQWEIPRENLAMEKVINNGAFAVVSKAYVRYLPDKKEWTTVAVKGLPG